MYLHTCTFVDPEIVIQKVSFEITALRKIVQVLFANIYMYTYIWIYAYMYTYICIYVCL